MDASLLVAHAGHWALWVLYAAPVLIVLGAALRSYLAQRREVEAERRGAEGAGRPGDGLGG